MPRQKRPFAETDANANASKPAAKRVATGAAATVAGDENAQVFTDEHEKMNTAHLLQIFKRRDIPCDNERKTAMVQRLREIDGTSPGRYDGLEKNDLAAILRSRGLRASAGTKAILIDRLKVDDIANPDRPFEIPTDDLEFVTVCRPIWDKASEAFKKRKARGAEEDDDEEEEEEEEDDEDAWSVMDKKTLKLIERFEPWSDLPRHLALPENRLAINTCMCGKDPADYPAWNWTMSKRGLSIVAELTKEYWKRDQDAHGEYIYNDWTGYGFQELLENEACLKALNMTVLTISASCYPEGLEQEKCQSALAAY
jgi:hypothetical protein